MRTSILAFITLAACGGAVTESEEPTQEQPSGSSTITVAPGFNPDPIVVTGTPQNAPLAQDDACPGGYAQEPNFVVVASEPIYALRFVARSELDATLRVQDPAGVVYCDDNTEGLNPAVTISGASGEYHVWVGHNLERGSSAFTLGISQDPSMMPSSLPNQGANAPVFAATPTPQPTGPRIISTAPVAGTNTAPPPTTAPVAGTNTAPPPTTSNFGEVPLTPGFMPDPHPVAGVSGAMEGDSVQATNWDTRCRGNVTTTPDHVLVARGHFPLLSILARAQGDITLVVQRPDGSYLCNDDTENLNPVVRGPFPPGSYRIWVGSYEQGTNHPYTLGFSEYETAMPSGLPPPAS